MLVIFFDNGNILLINMYTIKLYGAPKNKQFQIKGSLHIYVFFTIIINIKNCSMMSLHWQQGVGVLGHDGSRLGVEDLGNTASRLGVG